MGTIYCENRNGATANGARQSSKFCRRFFTSVGGSLNGTRQVAYGESQVIALRETRTLRSPELSTTRHVPIDRPAGVCLNVARGDAVMHRAKRVAEPVDDYFLITKLVGPRTRPIRWTWQIRRRSKPLGDKYDGEEYATAQDARLAGETALKDLLRSLGRGWPDKPRLPTLEN